MPDLAYIKVTLGTQRRAIVERLSRQEGRSISNVICQLVDEALEARGIRLGVPEGTLADLAFKNKLLLRKACVNNLDAIIDGAKPSETDLIRIAAALSLDDAEIDILFKRSFDNQDEHITSSCRLGS